MMDVGLDQVVIEELLKLPQKRLLSGDDSLVDMRRASAPGQSRCGNGAEKAFLFQAGE
jgi:hypothetical protein